MENLQTIIKSYKNDKYGNDSIWRTFAQKTNKIEFLKNHRDHIESNELGFGDRAFHYMWYLLLSYLFEKGSKPKVLEIGVYKGQVISLWALLSKKLCTDIEIHALSPFEGNMDTNPIINNKMVNVIRKLFSKKYRTNVKVGNIHLKDDYLGINQRLFSDFNLDFSKIIKHTGYSNDNNIIQQVRKHRFDLIYIDGDHNYDVVKNDILIYSELITINGLLVMDDASFYLPGSKFWKGYKGVSMACEIIENLGFSNILNVGHNRVYLKIKELKK